MNYDDLVPLYKILCLALIFLVPLAPAWALYRIAPSDKFLATGNFSGFKINATGAAAIYIVLFSVIILQTNSIMADISQTDTRINQLKTLQNERPWTIRYKLKLMSDSSHEITPVAYEHIVKQNSIVCMPAALHVGNDYKTLSFYMDSGDVGNLNNPIAAQIILSGGSTSLINISRNSPDVYIDSANRLITVNTKIKLGSADKARLSRIPDSQVAVLGPNDGTETPAPLSNNK